MLIISQLKVQPAATENEKQYYTLSNLTYIAFQNSYSFFWNFFDKQVFLRGRQIIEKYLLFWSILYKKNPITILTWNWTSS